MNSGVFFCVKKLSKGSAWLGLKITFAYMSVNFINNMFAVFLRNSSNPVVLSFYIVLRLGKTLIC